jgi:ABC-type oligopeptide transport system substrate-binding subunit
MRATRLAPAVGLAVAALATAGCAGGDEHGSATRGEPGATDTAAQSSANPRRLIGTVGSTDAPDAYDITLTTEDGVEVTTVLPPGEYRLEIADLSTIHNFHLRARYEGVDVATDVAATGKTTTIVSLQEPEAYIYECDAHPARMHVTFSIHGDVRTQN